MTEITAREANQQFSKLLQRAEAGEEVIITRRGRPVAKLMAMSDAEKNVELEMRRRKAVEFFSKGLSGGVVVDWTRDELYDRDDRSDVE